MKKVFFIVILAAMLFMVAADSATVRCAFRRAEFIKPRQAVAYYNCWYWWDGVRYSKPTELIHTFPDRFTLGH